MRIYTRCRNFQQAVKKLKFFAKKTCKDLRFLYNAPHTTTRCCESLEKQSESIIKESDEENSKK